MTMIDFNHTPAAPIQQKFTYFFLIEILEKYFKPWRLTLIAVI